MALLYLGLHGMPSAQMAQAIGWLGSGVIFGVAVQIIPYLSERLRARE